MPQKHQVPRERKDTYILDPENVAEMARLEIQDQLITKGMGGILPEKDNRLSEDISQVLDLACGPGEWTRQLARTHPQVEVTGIDISEIMTTYAQIKAQEAELTNIRFQLGNVLEALDFPDNTFDLVNARLLGGVLRREKWVSFVNECFRVTKPGGSIRLTEADNVGITNSPSQQQMNEWCTRGAHLAGYGLSTTDDYSLTPYLEGLLRDAGYQEIHQYTYNLDFSYGTELHPTQCRSQLIACQQGEGFCIQLGFTTLQEYRHVCKDLELEFADETFQGSWSFLTASGKKL